MWKAKRQGRTKEASEDNDRIPSKKDIEVKRTDNRVFMRLTKILKERRRNEEDVKR